MVLICGPTGSGKSTTLYATLRRLNALILSGDRRDVARVELSLIHIYRLVPFAREAGRIRCYGETGHDYTAAAEELEVLYGWQVEVVPITADDLQRLLLQHYRPGAQTASAAAGRTAEIGQGRQFLFALVGEALRDNASDIHLEPYEQRCRIRMRIDGKLAERYVVERAQYMPLVNQIKILASLDISEKRLPQDLSLIHI